LPLLCDDEYWETEEPSQTFKQPVGRPAQAEYINAYIRLIQMYSAAFRKQDASPTAQTE
ncbi:hypothetical protein C8R43DRAFT_872445, partial [Mycena crocata]